MSSRRSRSGGTRHRDDVEPVVEVLAEAAASRPRRARSRLVAATMRTSTVRVLPPPPSALDLALLQHAQQLHLHVAARSRRSRRGTACRRRPLEAAVARASTAPVNAPFSWPNSSLSSSVSGIAAQLTATNGPVARGELRRGCARATSSLPVPLSPSSSTVASRGAACMHDVHRAAPRERRADDRAPALLGELRLERCGSRRSSDCFSSALRTIAHDVRALERLGRRSRTRPRSSRRPRSRPCRTRSSARPRSRARSSCAAREQLHAASSAASSGR